jgi:hypothetical protein
MRLFAQTPKTRFSGFFYASLLPIEQPQATFRSTKAIADSIP